jgi:bifunctional DNA-binding transcriptional regulator/antitoxin component of YhaV-PrlF toxin-antitoxin module
MPVIRIGPKHQVTIPSQFFKVLDLKPGDLVDAQLREGAICLIPQKLVPKDQAWFWTEEWQQKEREADEAIAKGELSGPFDAASELIEHLHR